MVDGINNSKKALVSGLKAGLHKTDLGENTDNKMKSLFDIIDKDKNGVLDKEEINKFYNGDGETKGLNRNGDGKITRREAKKFLKAHQEELKNAGFTKKDMIEILNQFAADGENIEGMTGDSQKGYEVTYKDSENKRTIDKDGNYSNFDKDGNGETYDVNNTHLSSTKVDKENNTTTVTSYNNGEEESIDKVVTKKNDGSETTTVQYHDFGSGSEPTTKKVEKGSTVENYDIITDENGERTERILNKTIDKGNGVKEEHKYDYREDGSFTETVKDNAYPDNSTVYDCDKEGHHLSQSKTVGGNQYSVEYDGKGNTKVVLQKGETLEQLAKEFGCSVEDLKVLNGDNKIAYGDNVIVPKEFEADDDKIKNRKSSADVKSEVKAEEDAKEAERKHQAEIAERKRAIAKAQREAENAQLKPLGLKDRKGAGEKVDAHFGKTNRHVQLTKVGNAVNGRTICKDKSGKYYVVAHDGVILKEEYVKSTSLYAAGNKVDCVVKDKNGNKTNVKYAEVPGYKDKHGRTLVVDKNGKFYLRAHDGSLLKSDYVDRVERSDAIREDSAKAQEATFDLLDSQVASAEEAFNQQLKNDGWAGDVADGVSILWGSKNRASEVRKDLAKLRSDIAECKLAAQNEGDAGFKAKFKEKFGIDYNQNAIADYVQNPSAANYRKAFGTKQPIGERVAEYNQSQQTGAGVVKTGVKVAGAVAVGVATGGIGGAALGAAIVSGAVEETDRMNITGSYTDAQGNTQKTEGTFREGTDHLEILRDAVLDGGAVLAGGLAGKAAQVLVKGTQVTNAAGQTVNVLTKGQKVAQAGIMTSGDVAYGAAQEYIQTGEVSVEGTLMNAALSAVGNAASAGAFKKSPKPQGPKTLDNATGNGTKTTGGKLSDAKLDKVKNEVRDEIRSGATPERTAQIYKEADLHQAVNRKQGREIEHVVEQEAGFETHHKQRTETKEGGQAVIDKINENVERTSDAILKEKNSGALAPHDAATLEDNLVNNLNTKEEIEQFKQQLKERVGMDEKGSMFKYEVQGKDHAADLISKADKKLKQLADFDEVLNSIPAQGGMGDLTSIKSFINKPSTTAQQLDELIAKMEANPQLKKFGGTKKLVADMKAKSEMLKAKNIASKVEVQPKVEQPKVDTPEINKETIKDLTSKIDDAQIPQQHQELWKTSKENIEVITGELSNPSISNFKELLEKGRILLADIKKIADSAKGAIKAKLESLYNEIKTMLNNAKKEIQNTHTDVLTPKQRENVYTLREIYHSELNDVPSLRMEYPQYSHMSDKDLLDFFKLDEKHAAFVKNRKDLFANGDAKYMERAYWNDSPYELTNNHSAWKMHLYSVDELDYQQMAEVVLPYLNDHKIAHKTLSSTVSPELLAKTAPEQTGKAFTIYPQSQEEMAQIAKDLDRLIREHNLTTNKSHITGDNQLGNSGRLFYRYEFPTGKLKDRIYHPGERAPYDGNRGEGQYLAHDMTPADDPWLNFDPSNPKSKPGQAENIELSIENSSYIVEEGQFEVAADVSAEARPMLMYKVRTANGTEVFITAPKDATMAEINASLKETLKNQTIDARKFSNTNMQKLVGKTPQGELRSRLLDLDSAINSLPEGQIKSYVDSRLNEVKSLNDLFEIETLIDAYNESAGNYVHYQNLYRTKDGKQVKVKSDAAKMNAFIKDKSGKHQVVNAINSYADEALTAKHRVDIFKGDNVSSQKMYSTKKYIKEHPNSEMSEHLYNEYVSNRFTKHPELGQQLLDINKKYGVKLFVPSKYSKNRMETSLAYITEELDNWNTASNATAKMPAIIDFNTANVAWYDTRSAYGQSAASAYSERASGSLAFHDMDKQTIAQSMRHELTHTNDQTRVGKKIPEKYNLDEIMPKKTIIRNGNEVKVPDFENCMYVDEFRAAGLPENRIAYAYNNPAEFIARASEGDMSKYSPEFKQMLIDFGMPEWMFKMQPKDAM